jgi:hypothetical protein
MVKSAPSCGAGCHGSLFRGRVALTTRPSLSSLRDCNGSDTAIGCAFVGCCLRGAACAVFDVVATRPTLDATLALFGRGMVNRSRVGRGTKTRVGVVERAYVCYVSIGVERVAGGVVVNIAMPKHDRQYAPVDTSAGLGRLGGSHANHSPTTCAYAGAVVTTATKRMPSVSDKASLDFGHYRC